MLLVREGHGFDFTKCISYFPYYSDIIPDISKARGVVLFRSSEVSVPRGGEGMAGGGSFAPGSQSLGTALFTF